ncbi:hypothetical protein DFJ74DRAFT_671963 [Hyaloraphidium curvatum]|nr:hypothetical protein DFJ74DRAFT_671963 [Hyaloraphidium curvatum]
METKSASSRGNEANAGAHRHEDVVPRAQNLLPRVRPAPDLQYRPVQQESPLFRELPLGHGPRRALGRGERHDLKDKGIGLQRARGLAVLGADPRPRDKHALGAGVGEEEADEEPVRRQGSGAPHDKVDLRPRRAAERRPAPVDERGQRRVRVLPLLQLDVVAQPRRGQRRRVARRERGLAHFLRDFAGVFAAHLGDLVVPAGSVGGCFGAAGVRPGGAGRGCGGGGSQCRG